MADPRTKEELLHIIEKSESESENYKEFKESLTDLNRDIDELMKPGKEGWKLLDENTFLPFYDKYLKTPTGREAVQLPSTSPANAAWNMGRLLSVWKPAVLGALEESSRPAAAGSAEENGRRKTEKTTQE